MRSIKKVLKLVQLHGRMTSAQGHCGQATRVGIFGPAPTPLWTKGALRLPWLFSPNDRRRSQSGSSRPFRSTTRCRSAWVDPKGDCQGGRELVGGAIAGADELSTVERETLQQFYSVAESDSELGEVLEHLWVVIIDADQGPGAARW